MPFLVKGEEKIIISGVLPIKGELVGGVIILGVLPVVRKQE